MRDPYADVDAYLALPRTVDLLLSPDGTRLVAVVTTSDAEGPTRRALWALDPRGHARPQRLPVGCSGPAPVFLHDGRLVVSPAQPPDSAGAPAQPGALAIEPDVILMDEPCSALDPISTAAIEDLMLDLKERYSIVIVTHNMQQAARVSDRTAFFNVAKLEEGKRVGQLVEFSPTEKIFTNPEDERTKEYVTGKFG